MAEDLNIQKLREPSEFHKKLEKMLGKWQVTIIFWTTPDSQPFISNGTAEVQSLLGGRFFQTHFNADYGGAPMEGYALDGYDNVKECFMYQWLDNFSTGIISAEGKYDSSADAILYIGDMFNYHNMKASKYKQVLKFIDENNFYQEMFNLDDSGTEFKSLKLEYRKS